jgi:hypothetical protein
MSGYTRKPGEVYGFHWYQPSTKGTTEFPHVAVDVNWWKSFLHERLATAPGEVGAMTIFGDPAQSSRHVRFAEHVSASEYCTLTHGHGRDVQEWYLKPTKPDNHWWDCLVGCAAAASMVGIALPGHEPSARRTRKKYTQADLLRR